MLMALIGQNAPETMDLTLKNAIFTRGNKQYHVRSLYLLLPDSNVRVRCNECKKRRHAGKEKETENSTSVFTEDNILSV